MRRLLMFVTALVVVGLNAPLLAQTVKMERVMRHVQARRVSVGLPLAVWPELSPGVATPAYPPDDYYGGTTKVAGANAIISGIWDGSTTLVSRYYNNTPLDTALSGGTFASSEIVVMTETLLPRPTPSPTDDVSAINAIDVSWDRVQRLTWETASSVSHPLNTGSSAFQYRTYSWSAGDCKPFDFPPYNLTNCCAPATDCQTACRESVLAQLAQIAASSKSMSSWQLVGPATLEQGFNNAAERKTVYRCSCGSVGILNGCFVPGTSTPLTVGFDASVSWKATEYRVDLAGSCGTLLLTARAVSTGSNSATPGSPWAVDGLNRMLTAVPGGSVVTGTVGSILGVPGSNQEANWNLTSLRGFYRGCYDQLANEGDPIGNGFGSAIGNLSANLRSGNLPAGCPEEESKSIVSPYPATSYPVSVATGQKTESAVDLDVKVHGEDFQFRRDYTSDPAICNPANRNGLLLGRGWSSECFRFLTVSALPGGGVAVNMGGPPLDSSLRYEPVSGQTNRWSSGGPATQYLEKSTVQLDGRIWPVWRLVEPGQWTKDFLRAPDAGESGVYVFNNAIVGLLLREGDFYDNFRYYLYSLTADQPRVKAIYINGTPSDLYADAIIRFEWESGVTKPLLAGLLRKVTVLRPRDYFQVFGNPYTRLGARGYAQAESVEYTYAADGGLGVSGATPTFSTDLGTEADLVQVIRRQTVDSAPPGIKPEWVSVSQYRYHTTGQPATSAFGLAGQTHQLKAVFQATQIEYHAQKQNENLAVPPENAVELIAAQLLTKSDGEDLVWASGTAPKLRGLAAKLVGYDAQGRVSEQFVLAGCACGGGSQGLKELYTYYPSYNASATGDGLTTRVQSLKITGWNPITTSEYRTEYHDMVRIGGVPYLRNHAVVEPAQEGGRAWVNRYERDPKGNVLFEYSPAAITGYAPTTGSVQPNVTVSLTAGLAKAYTYTSDNRVSSVSLRDSQGAFRLVSETLYPFTYVPTGATHPYLPRETRFYRNAGDTSEDSIEKVTYDYEFYYQLVTPAPGAAATGASIPNTPIAGKLLWRTTTRELELASENGLPSGASPLSDTTVEVFDMRGRLAMEMAPNKRTRLYRYSEHKINGDYDCFGSVREVSFDGYSCDQNVLGGSLSFLTTPPVDVFCSTASSRPRMPPAWNTSIAGSPLFGSDNVRTQIIERFDLHGRPTFVREFSGPDNDSGPYVTSSYSVAFDDLRPGILYFAQDSFAGRQADVVQLSATVAKTASPLTTVWRDAGGKVLRSSGFEPPIGEYIRFNSLSTGSILPRKPNAREIARSASFLSLSGLVTSESRWSEVPAATADPNSGIKETTSYTYDELGRLKDQVSPAGTITRVAQRDALDRVLEVQVGTSSTNLVTVSKSYYDTPANSGTPSQGTGNGNLRWFESFTGDSWGSGDPQGVRTVRRYFDERDRLITVAADDSPFQATRYDNLNRVTESAVFEPSFVGGVPDVPSNLSDSSALARRGQYSRNFYSQRGLLWRSETATNPTSSTTEYLRTDRWFDHNGRVVAEAAPGGFVTKTQYDLIDRPARSIVTSSRPSGNYLQPSGSDRTIIDVSTDKVLEQTDRTYSTTRPLLLQTAKRYRLHNADASSQGLLTDTTSITQYESYGYDLMGRLRVTVNDGTNKSAPATSYLTIGGTAPAPLPFIDDVYLAGTALNSRLHSINEYDSVRGFPNGTSSFVGLIQGQKTYTRTRTYFDDLGRDVVQVSAYDNSVGWPSREAANASPWVIDDPTGLQLKRPNLSNLSLSPGVNRLVANVYDNKGRLAQMRAVNVIPGTPTTVQEQVTAYVFGTTNTAASNGSRVFSNDLVAEVRYPDPSDGLPNANGTQNVQFSYNRLGEIRSKTDQNGTVQSFAFDRAGRVLSNKVQVATNSTVDTYVTEIKTTFDALGRKQTVKSLGGTAGTTIRNAVRFGYTPLWQLQSVEQDVDSDFNTSGSPTRQVTNVYDTKPTGMGNFSRMDKMLYPDHATGAPSGGTPVTFEYAVGSLDAAISRPSLLKLGTQADPVAAYTYFGVNGVTVVDYPMVNVQFDRTYSAEDRNRRWGPYSSQPVGTYPGFDRYLRPISSMWVSGLSDSSLTSTQHPPFDAWTMGYDAGSRMVNRRYAVPGSIASTTDWQHAYDASDRLSESKRGRYDATNTLVQSPGKLAWSLDALGNWSQTTRNDASGLKTRSRAFAGNNQFTDPGTVYDNNGNIREEFKESPTTFAASGEKRRNIFDAWNRLVEVRIQSGSSDYAIARYDYNGLNWRVAKTVDPKPIRNGTLSQRKEMYYSGSWQLLMEDIDDDYGQSGNTGFDRRTQYVWGIRGTDDIVLKREDRPIAGAPGDPDNNIPPDPPTLMDGAYDFTWHYLTDLQGSVNAIVLGNPGSTGSLRFGYVEGATYSPYGTAQRHARADVNRSGDVSVQDTFDFLTMWFAVPTVPAADINMSGTVTPQDIFDYLNFFFSDPPKETTVRPWGIWRAYPGALVAEESEQYPDNSIGYCGYWLDSETGLYCVRNRYYDPANGRWLQRDPIGYSEGMSLYQYVGSSPLMGADPMGLWFEETATAWVNSDNWFLRGAGMGLGIAGGYYEGLADGTARSAIGVGKAVREVGYTISDGIGLGRDIYNGTANYQPVSALGKRSVALADSGATTQEVALETRRVAVEAAKTISTAGLYPVVQSAVDWAKTGDPIGFQEAAGSNLLYALTATAYPKQCQTRTAGPEGANRARFAQYVDDLARQESGLPGPRPNFTDPFGVRFYQDSASREFSDVTKGTIQDLADGLRRGDILADNIPPIRLVERDGKIYTLDHRRLEAFRRARVQVPYRMATPEEAAANGWKHTSTNEGTSIRIRGE